MLVMSATPIPRTLAIILYGDLDISIIDELPANRQPIKNCVVNREFRPNAYRFIENEVRAYRQAYVICPMVEPSEMLEAENVIDYTEELRRALSPSIRVEYLHGKMKGKEKMRSWKHLRQMRFMCWYPPRSSRSESMSRMPPL